MVTSFEEDLIYIAGFFDGEGCICSRLNGGNPQIHITIAQKDPFILKYIQNCFGFGKVMKIISGINKSEYWRYKICSASQVYSFLRLIIPYLRGKKVQAKIALDLTKRIMETFHERMTMEENEIRIEMVNKIKELKKEDISLGKHRRF